MAELKDSDEFIEKMMDFAGHQDRAHRSGERAALAEELPAKDRYLRHDCAVFSATGSRRPGCRHPTRGSLGPDH